MNSHQTTLRQVTHASRCFRLASCSAVALAWLSVGNALGHGGYHDVVSEIQAELQQRPGDAALRYKIAQAHISHDEWRAGLQEIKLIERIAPGVYPTGYLRGLALHIAGKDEAAKVSLNGFLTKNPDHAEALTTRGRVLVKLGSPLAAVVDFQKALKSSFTPNSELIVDLAHALVDSGKAEEASRAIDAGLETAGDVTSLMLCALEIETATGSWDLALSRIDALQEIAPRPERWMAERAVLLTNAGHSTEARVAWAALRDHLLSLPNLERGSPHNMQLHQQSRQALGETIPTPVIAPPASGKL